jgi:hypothetical protein
MTGRGTERRLRELTSHTGLVARGRIAFCVRVDDRAGVEDEAKRLLADKRVRRSREFFYVTPDEAQRAVEDAVSRVARWSVIWPVRRAVVRRLRQRRRRRRVGMNWSGALAAAALLLALWVLSQ